jgi:hypothetical protein
MNRWHRRILLALVAWTAAGAGWAADDSASPLPGDGMPKVYCVDGLERILPGDYYGCRALYHLQRKHYRQAMAMLKESAYWANKEAQHQLGLAYVDGDVPGFHADPARGIAWLALAQERHQPDYERDYALAVARSTPAQRDEAAAIYLDLRKRYGDAVAGKRATDRFNREIRDIDDAANGGVAWIAGFGPFPVRAYTLSQKLHDQAEQDFAGLHGSVLIGPLQRVQDRVDTATLKPRTAAEAAAAAAPPAAH